MVIFMEIFTKFGQNVKFCAQISNIGAETLVFAKAMPAIEFGGNYLQDVTVKCYTHTPPV